eukprot:scaffold34609_cov146-Amphora_coffeaeformis.AAC.21
MENTKTQPNGTVLLLCTCAWHSVQRGGVAEGFVVGTFTDLSDSTRSGRSFGAYQGQSVKGRGRHGNMRGFRLGRHHGQLYPFFVYRTRNDEGEHNIGRFFILTRTCDHFHLQVSRRAREYE